MNVHFLALEVIVRRRRDDTYERENPETGAPLPVDVWGYDPHEHVEPVANVKPPEEWPVNRRVDPSYRPEDLKRGERHA